MLISPTIPKEIIQTQLTFEQALIENQFADEATYQAAFIQAIYNLPESQAQLILDCAFRKGLLEQIDSVHFQRKTPTEPEIVSVFQHAEKTGMRPKSLVRSVNLVPAFGDVSKKLELKDGTPVFQQKRTRLINGLVIANQCNSIPQCIAPDLESLDLKNKSFQVVLESKYHAVVHEIQEDFKLAFPTEEDGEILELENSDQVIVVTRLSLSATHKPLVWANIHLNPMYFHLVEQLWPGAANLLRS